MLDSVGFTIAIATVIVLLFLMFNVFRKPAEVKVDETESSSETQENSKQTNKAKEKKQNIKPQGKVKETVFKHKLLSTTLKAHSDTVTGIDWSPNGKYLLSCAADRSIFMWSTKELELQQHKNIRCNVEFDHAIQVRFTPDSKAFIAGLGVSNTIRAYKIVKKEDGSNMNIMQAALQDFPQKHKADLINVGLSCTAKFLMTCSKDTIINIWNFKGDLLGTVDTRLGNNSFAAVSTCGRFFGVCGFTPDVKLWEVLFDKNGEFREIKRAFELKGHSAGVYNFSFNTDSTRMASVSKDQTWKLWDTNIDYARGQEARLLLTGELEQKGPSLISLSPDSYSIAVCVNNNLYFYNALTGELDQTIENICNDSVHEISFSIDNKYLAVACDRHVKVFFNLTGHKVAIVDLETKLKTAKTEASKERFQQMIDDHEKTIEKIEQRVFE